MFTSTSSQTVQSFTYDQLVKKILEKGKVGLAKLFLSEEDILQILRENAGAQVIEFRRDARELGGLMRAMADPETEKEEPLERLRIRRANMVAFAGKLVNLSEALVTASKQTADEQGKVQPSPELIALAAKFDISVPKKVLPSWLTTQAEKINLQVTQASQEIAGLDKGELGIAEETYKTYSEAYAVAVKNLQQAEDILDQAENRAPGLMKAVKAFKKAIELRDKQKGKGVSGDAVNDFMTNLTAEMEQARGEYRADEQVDKDLDAMRPVTFETQMAKYDAGQGDAGVLDEIRKSAAGK